VTNFIEMKISGQVPNVRNWWVSVFPAKRKSGLNEHLQQRVWPAPRSFYALLRAQEAE